MTLITIIIFLINFLCHCNKLKIHFLIFFSNILTTTGWGVSTLSFLYGHIVYSNIPLNARATYTLHNHLNERAEEKKNIFTGFSFHFEYKVH